MRNNYSYLSPAIVRIYAAGTIAGVGFFIGDQGQIATCAHVIQHARVGPDNTVKVEYQINKSTISTQATVEYDGWSEAQHWDIAILRVDAAPTADVYCLPVGSARNSAGNAFVTIGYSSIGELLVDGRVDGLKDNESVLQITSSKITKGVSGAPVFDTKRRLVVGVVVAFPSWKDKTGGSSTEKAGDSYGRIADINHAVPSELLREVYPSINWRSDPINTAPPLPLSYVERKDLLEATIKQIAANQESARSQPAIVVLQGPSGFGKSTLAQAVSLHPDISEKYSDGVLWLSFGRNPNILAIACDQLEALTSERPHFASPEPALRELRETIKDRSILLVMDDVWSASDVWPLLQSDSSCAYLVTTGFGHVAAHLQLTPVDVSEMTTREASQLISRGATLTKEERQVSHGLVRLLGRWPLILDMAASFLNEVVNIDKVPFEKALAGLYERLKLKGYSGIDRDSKVAFTIEINLNHLGARRARFWELIAFPEDINIPFDIIRILWQQDSFDTEDTLREIQRFSLFSDYDPLNRTLRLHPLVRAYLLSQEPGKQSELHRRLLESFRPTEQSRLFANPVALQLPTWADLAPKHLYMWQYIFYHLQKAGYEAELIATAMDIRYLLAKINATTVHDAIDDLSFALAVTQGNQALSETRAILIRMGNTLGRCESVSDLTTTFYSRVRHFEHPTFLREALSTLLAYPCLLSRHRLPDLPPEELKYTIAKHMGSVNSCNVSKDGDLIISSSDDMTVRLWDSKSGVERLALLGHKGAVYDAVASNDGALIASASEDKTIKIWDAYSGQELATLHGHAGAVRGCAINAEGTIAVSASEDRTLKIWDILAKKERSTLIGHKGWVNRCVISPDGGTIVSASDDQTLRVWDVQSGKEKFVLHGHDDRVNDCCISTDGKLIISASDDLTLRSWDILTGKELAGFVDHDSAVRACAISQDGTRIASATHNGLVNLWDTVSGVLLRTLRRHVMVANDCAIDPNGQLIFSASEDCTVNAWDIPRIDDRGVTATNICSYTNCSSDGDGSLVISAMSDGALWGWNAKTGDIAFKLLAHESSVNGCALGRSAKVLVSVADRAVKVWDLNDRSCTLTLHGHADSVNGCAISHDEAFLVSASYDHSLKVWDSATGQEKFALLGHGAPVTECEISPDCSYIVSTSYDETLRIWDAATGSERAKLSGHASFVNDCVISSDSTFIVSASSDGTLKKWNAQTGQEMLTLEGHKGFVTSCAISPDDSIVLSVSHDQSVKLWDAQSGKCISTLQVDGPLLDCSWPAVGGYVAAVGFGGLYFLEVQQ